MNYDEKYFSTLNYTNYLERQPKYTATAREITELLKKLTLITPDSHILDFGCGPGFLLKGLESLEYRNLYGYDISEYARSKVRESNTRIRIIEGLFPKAYDIMFALDVFEHMTDLEINKAFSAVCYPPKVLIFRIPVKENFNDSTFHLEVSRKDSTHINCKTKYEWMNLINSLDYTVILPLNLYTIYDSPGVFCGIAL